MDLISIIAPSRYLYLQIWVGSTEAATELTGTLAPERSNNFSVVLPALPRFDRREKTGLFLWGGGGFPTDSVRFLPFPWPTYPT